MSLLVTGSIGIDTVTTPHGLSNNCLGGSAVYFSMAASFFSPVRFIGAVGADCPFDLANVFAGRDVNLGGLEIRNMSKTFRWKGSYHGSMEEAITDNIELNVLAEAPPAVPENYKDSKFVFLANTAPSLQHELLDQLSEPGFVAADTMHCWIEGHNEQLKELLKKISALIINEDEAKTLAGDKNVVSAGQKILDMGPEIIVIKKGASGSILFDRRDRKFILPAFPSTKVIDPTGAGDSFAGAMMGYLASRNRTDFETLKQAVVYGTILASFTIEDFSLRRLTEIDKNDIKKRFELLKKMTQF